MVSPGPTPCGREHTCHPPTDRGQSPIHQEHSGGPRPSVQGQGLGFDSYILAVVADKLVVADRRTPVLAVDRHRQAVDTRTRVADNNTRDARWQYRKEDPRKRLPAPTSRRREPGYVAARLTRA
jgi:hypothetical protein